MNRREFLKLTATLSAALPFARVPAIAFASENPPIEELGEMWIYRQPGHYVVEPQSICRSWPRRVETPIGPVSAHDVFSDHVGWHTDSAQFGESGNAVLNGHNYGVFKGLLNTIVGDVLILQSSAEETYVYLVEDVVTVRVVTTEERRAAGRYIYRDGEDRVTMVTCVEDGSKYRIIVIGRPV